MRGIPEAFPEICAERKPGGKAEAMAPTSGYSNCILASSA
jgi:hypothetical protein